jgi:hypothetical protein
VLDDPRNARRSLPGIFRPSIKCLKTAASDPPQSWSDRAQAAVDQFLTANQFLEYLHRPRLIPAHAALRLQPRDQLLNRGMRRRTSLRVKTPDQPAGGQRPLPTTPA